MKLDCLRDINWFALHTRRFRETVAASHVAPFVIDVFLPMVKVEPLNHSVIKFSTKPLFPAYFFARFCPLISLESVESARGVLQVVKSGSCPIPVDDQVIREVQDRVGVDGL